MGKGGKSSSSNTTTTTNTSGQNAIDGDNLGVSIAGVNGSTMNITATDHGAIRTAAGIAELALSSSSLVAEEALKTNREVTESALDMGSQAVSDALGFGELSLDKAFDFGRDSLAVSQETFKEGFKFGRDAMDLNAALSEMAIESVTDSHHENLQMLAGLAGNQAAQNSESIQAIKDLAEMNVDGGQVATSKQMTMVIFIVFGFLALMFIFGGKR